MTNLIAEFLKAHPNIKLARGLGSAPFSPDETCELCIQQTATLALRWERFKAAGLGPTLEKSSSYVDDNPSEMWLDIRMLNDLGNFSPEARVKELVPLADAIVRLFPRLPARVGARKLMLLSMVNQFLPKFLPRMILPKLWTRDNLVAEGISPLATACAEAQDLRAAKRALYALIGSGWELGNINQGALSSLASQIHYSQSADSGFWNPPAFSLHYRVPDNEDDTLVFIARLWRGAIEQAERELPQEQSC